MTDLAVSGAVRSFSAVEAQNTGPIVLATFDDPNTLATVANVNATLPVGGWGDGTPTAVTGLAVTQVGINPIDGDPIFDVVGNHTYAEAGTFTVNVDITTNGGVVTHLTPGTATVVDAKLIGTSGNEIAGIEGNPITPPFLGSFTDNNQAATVADFTTGGGSTVINWGDGSPLQTLTAADITSIGTPDGVTWLISASHTYPDDGTFAYTITVTDDDGATTIVNGSAFISEAPLIAGVGVVQSGHTGIPFNNVLVGTFTDGNPGAGVGDFTGVIDWGDGSPTSLPTFVAVGGGVFDVFGSHTFKDPGVFSVQTDVFDGDTSVTLFATFTITDLPVTGAVNNFSGIEGQDTGTIVLATYEDPNTLATVANEHATLPVGGWGDGMPTAVTTLTVIEIGKDSTTGDPIFEVTGSHTYADEGTFTVNINVTTSGGVTTALTPGTATVIDAKLVGTSGNEISGIEGTTTGTVLLGSFTDNNQGATAADFTSGGGSTVVNWGDGSAPQTLTAANLTLTGSPNGVTFTINAAHTYTEEGTYAYTVTVTDDGGSVTVVNGSAIIADAALTAGPATLLTPNTGIALPSTTVVGTFTDANTFATPADYRTTIDWGDGTPMTTGTVVATATPGDFEVEGGHTYMTPGVYTTKITVVDDGLSQVIVIGSATVTDLGITGAVQNFTAVEDRDTGVIVLATFTDPNTLATVASVTASLPANGWGDGTPTADTTLTVTQIGVTPLTAAVDPGDPIFQVTGRHTYAEEGTFTVNINVTTIGGVVTALTPGTATVIDAPLTSSNGTEITGVEGTTTGTVLLGTFTDANQGATTADFLPTPGGNGGSVVVNWGDGSALQTLTAANLAAQGTPNGVIFTVSANHIYVEEGTYAYTVTVTDDGGSVTIFSGSAIVADAALSPALIQPTVNTVEATIFPVPVFSPPLFNGPVATFSDANPLPPTGSSSAADFTAMIDWGDGTPMTAGTIVPLLGGSTYNVTARMHIRMPILRTTPPAPAISATSRSRSSSRTTAAHG